MTENHTVVDPLFFNEVSAHDYPPTIKNNLNRIIKTYNDWLKYFIKNNKALIQICGRDVLIDIEEGRQTWARRNNSAIELIMLMKSEIDRLSPDLVNIVHTR
jgi:hypothetical protein